MPARTGQRAAPAGAPLAEAFVRDPGVHAFDEVESEQVVQQWVGQQVGAGHGRGALKMID